MGWITNPLFEQEVNTTQGLQSAYEPADAMWTRFFRQLKKGGDVSDIGMFAPLKQQQATQMRSFKEGQGEGDLALATAGMGANAAPMFAAQERVGEERLREAGGQQYANALASAIGEGSNYQATRAGQENAFTLGKQGLINPYISANSQYRPSMWGGLLSSLIGGAATVGAAAV